MRKQMQVVLVLFSFLASPMCRIEAYPYLAFVEVTDNSLIGDIRNNSFLDGCGCYVKRPGRNSYVFLAEITESKRAWMNIDGRDTRLSFVSSTEPSRPLRRGERFVQKYSTDGLIVQITYIVTTPNSPGGEVTKYAAAITVTKNNRTQTIQAIGECGC